MGNEESSMIDQKTPPRVLENRSIEAVAKYILENDVRRIVVMVCLFYLAPHVLCCLASDIRLMSYKPGGSRHQYFGRHS